MAKFIETKCRRGDYQGLGERRVGSSCLIGIEFQFGRTEKLWR